MKHDNLRGLVGESWIWPLGKSFDYFKDTIVPYLEAEIKKVAQYRNSPPSKKQLLPPTHNIFRVLKEIPFENVRVVILAQDPYHNIGAATGLCFDNPKSQKPSPSLSNILKEIEADLGTPSQAFDNVSSYLEHLPSQGVLLLNAALTVERENPGSHLKLWKPFTEELIHQINTRLPNVVWVLWGKPAQKFEKLITNKTHKIVKGAHPSPFSFSAFKGQKFFSKVNSLITSTNPIRW